MVVPRTVHPSKSKMPFKMESRLSKRVYIVSYQRVFRHRRRKRTTNDNVVFQNTGEAQIHDGRRTPATRMASINARCHAAPPPAGCCCRRCSCRRRRPRSPARTSRFVLGRGCSPTSSYGPWTSSLVGNFFCSEISVCSTWTDPTRV